MKTHFSWDFLSISWAVFNTKLTVFAREGVSPPVRQCLGVYSVSVPVPGPSFLEVKDGHA